MKKTLGLALLCASIGLTSAHPAAAYDPPPIVPPGCVLQWVTTYKWVVASWDPSGQPNYWVLVPYTYPVCR